MGLQPRSYQRIFGLSGRKTKSCLHRICEGFLQGNGRFACQISRTAHYALLGWGWPHRLRRDEIFYRILGQRQYRPTQPHLHSVGVFVLFPGQHHLQPHYIDGKAVAEIQNRCGHDGKNGLRYSG